MKFNDNTVNEASWEELLKESIGGRSNTSAYSLVYIDASKPEILLPAILEISGKSKYDISNLTTVKIMFTKIIVNLRMNAFVQLYNAV